ncbi:hypothetical protein PT077_02450 [Erysipelothrix rhusiopathiae]|nr:hypothetical protein [Erysipelothrix rhusiopathiae]
MKKSIILLFITISLTSCTLYPSNQPITSTRKNFSETQLVSIPNTLEQPPTSIESEEIHDPDLPQSNNPSNDEKPQHKEDLSQSVAIETKAEATTVIKDIPQKASPVPSPSTTPENTSPTDQISKPEESTAPLLPKTSHISQNSHFKGYFNTYFLSILIVLMVLKVFDIILTSLILFIAEI